MSGLPLVAEEWFYGKSVVEKIGKTRKELDYLYAKLLNMPFPILPFRKWSKAAQLNFVKGLKW